MQLEGDVAQLQGEKSTLQGTVGDLRDQLAKALKGSGEERDRRRDEDAARWRKREGELEARIGKLDAEMEEQQKVHHRQMDSIHAEIDREKEASREQEARRMAVVVEKHEEQVRALHASVAELEARVKTAERERDRLANEEKARKMVEDAIGSRVDLEGKVARLERNLATTLRREEAAREAHDAERVKLEDEVARIEALLLEEKNRSAAASAQRQLTIPRPVPPTRSSADGGGDDDDESFAAAYHKELELMRNAYEDELAKLRAELEKQRQDHFATMKALNDTTRAEVNLLQGQVRRLKTYEEEKKRQVLH